MNIDVNLNEDGLRKVIKSVASLVSTSKDPDFIINGARFLGELGEAGQFERLRKRRIEEQKHV